MEGNRPASSAAMIAVCALRGAAGFLVGGLVGVAADAVGVVVVGLMSIPLGFVLGAGLGAAGLTLGRKDLRTVRASAIGAGAAMAFPGIIVPLTVAGLEGRGLDGYGVAAWAMSFALAGALVGACLRWGADVAEFGKLAAMVAAGALAFGLGGAVGGAVCFALLTLPNGGVWGPAAGSLAALLLGGTLTGAALGAVESRRSRAAPVAPKRWPALSGDERLAISAAVLGIAGLVVAMIYPLRFKLPMAVSVSLSAVPTVSAQAAIMLAVLGAPPLAIGILALRRIRRTGGSPRQALPAWVGAIDGAAIVLLAMTLIEGPAARGFQTRYAHALLDSWQGRPGHWNYGNAFHQGHIILGHVALETGDLAEAKAQLLLAAGTPGSPQLATCGPDTALARDLLFRGEGEAVLEYFRLCRRFWTHERERLDEWSLAVRRHKMPDFAGRIVPGSLQSAKIFVEEGGDVNAHDFFAGRTILHVATLYGHARSVEYLLGRGARSNAQDEDGATPLHLAADPQVAEVLTAHGADLALRDNLGRTPLDAAEADGRTAVAEVLRRCGAPATATPRQARGRPQKSRGTTAPGT